MRHKMPTLTIIHMNDISLLHLPQLLGLDNSVYVQMIKNKLTLEKAREIDA
jgi:hypothetical protein